ncbi:hypothetical protein L2E82_19288 [Cichorium intybus]|uniref:Uncharacterized protein n=1 Tax=Cichorium intybus TaxID=13427 RepID=A0ACB9FC09_CICIN|nr:hypothetical protein L2E82_19288 [Cichorium intybus]
MPFFPCGVSYALGKCLGLAKIVQCFGIEVSLLNEGSQGKQRIDQIEQEISLLSQFKHDNIVSIGVICLSSLIRLGMEAILILSITHPFKTKLICLKTSVAIRTHKVNVQHKSRKVFYPAQPQFGYRAHIIRSPCYLIPLTNFSLNNSEIAPPKVAYLMNPEGTMENHDNKDDKGSNEVALGASPKSGVCEDVLGSINYVAPQPPSPVREGSDEGYSPTPRTSISYNNFNAVPRGYAESHEKPSQKSHDLRSFS